MLCQKSYFFHLRSAGSPSSRPLRRKGISAARFSVLAGFLSAPGLLLPDAEVSGILQWLPAMHPCNLRSLLLILPKHRSIPLLRRAISSECSFPKAHLYFCFHAYDIFGLKTVLRFRALCIWFMDVSVMRFISWKMKSCTTLLMDCSSSLIFWFGT